MNPLILVAPAAEVTRRPTGDPPGDPPGDFGSALAQAGQAPPPKGRADGARTATAEGADTEAADGGSGRADTDAPAAAIVAEDGTSSTPAPASPAAVTAVPELAPAATPVPTEPALTVTPAQPQQPVATELQPAAGAPEQADTTAAPVAVKAPPGYVWQDPASAQGAPTAAANGTVAPAATPDTAPSLAAPPVVAAQPAPASTAATATPAQAEAAPGADPVAQLATQALATTTAPAVGSETKHHEQPATGREQQPDHGDATPAPQPQQAAAVETAKPAVDQPQAQPAAAKAEPVATAAEPSPQPVAAAPQQALASDRPAAIEAPVRAHAQLAHLIETARTVVRMAAREGAAQAHITLHPAELGEVSIRLRYHAGGISADVRADSQAAAQALQQASGELKRSLEAQGLVVHDLDVRTGEQERQRAHEQHRHGRGHRHAHTFDLPDQTTIDTSSLPLPTGAVDVLA